jgi:hypothetical protein
MLGTRGTARAAHQSFSGVDKNAHYGAEVREALIHRDVCLPKEMPAEHINLKNLYIKTTSELN